MCPIIKGKEPTDFEKREYEKIMENIKTQQEYAKIRMDELLGRKQE